MAKAYQCDRCGNLYEKNKNVFPKFLLKKYDERNSFESLYTNLDLCPDCQEKLEEFVIEGGFYDEESE